MNELDNKQSLVDSFMRDIKPGDIVVDLEKCKTILERWVYKDDKFREELVRSIIYELKPEDIVVDLQKMKKVLQSYGK